MDDLNTQTNSQPNNLGTRIKNFVSLPKFIFAVLGLILLVELIYAVRVLTLPVSSPVVSRNSIQAKVAKISLNTPKKVYGVSEIVPVSVTIDTGGQTIDGADLIIQYDPKILEASSAGLTKGGIFEEYPIVSVDTSKGLISISGISSLQNGFKGVGQFANINLRAKVTGRTSLTIDFKGKGATIDSNLVEANASKDILEKVDNLELTVQ